MTLGIFFNIVVNLKKFQNFFQKMLKLGFTEQVLEKISEFFSKSVEIGVHGTGARKNFRKNFKKSMTL